MVKANDLKMNPYSDFEAAGGNIEFGSQGVSDIEHNNHNTRHRFNSQVTEDQRYANEIDNAVH
jgi:hypothetical protein